MVPTLPHKVIIADVVYPAVLLTHGKSISLLPAMVAGIQGGLQVLTKKSVPSGGRYRLPGKAKDGLKGEAEVKTLNPRVELT